MIRGISALSMRCRIMAGLRSGTRLDDLPRWCGDPDSSGVNEDPQWQDWTGQATTPDQERIEDVLERCDVRGRVLLHVGIGNSSLAKRFQSSAQAIDGITIEQNEYRHAMTLGIPNYRPLIGNKYDSRLVQRLDRQYDYIIDNNPTAFSCCRWHLSTMLASYAALLKSDGVFVSDRMGLNWTSPANDPRWGLTVSEWCALAASFNFKQVQYTDDVIGLRKGP